MLALFPVIDAFLWLVTFEHLVDLFELLILLRHTLSIPIDSPKLVSLLIDLIQSRLHSPLEASMPLRRQIESIDLPFAYLSSYVLLSLASIGKVVRCDVISVEVWVLIIVDLIYFHIYVLHAMWSLIDIDLIHPKILSFTPIQISFSVLREDMSRLLELVTSSLCISLCIFNWASSWALGVLLHIWAGVTPGWALLRATLRRHILSYIIMNLVAIREQMIDIIISLAHFLP